MLGYLLRNTPTVVEKLNRSLDMHSYPKRKSYNACWEQFQKDMNALSGKTDLTLQGVDAQVEQSFADEYARAECADGRHRELHPNDPTET